MPNPKPARSIAQEPLEARRLLSAALSNPSSVLPPRLTSAPGPAATRAAPSAPAASNAEDGSGETDAPGESDDAGESTDTSQQQQPQQGDGETTDLSAAPDGETAAPAATTPPGNADDAAPTPPATEPSQPAPRANPAPVPVATTPVGPAVEQSAPAAAPVLPPDRPDAFDAPVLLASQAGLTVRSSPFATLGELAVSELAHTLFSTRAVSALGAMQRAGVEALPTIVRTLIGTSASAAVPLPGASPSAAAAAPDLADMADLAARTMTSLGRPDAVAAFADAIAGFAHDSAAVGSLAAVATTFARAPTAHGRAWAVSAAVIAADAILVGQWYGARRRERGGRADGDGKRMAPAAGKPGG